MFEMFKNLFADRGGKAEIREGKRVLIDVRSEVEFAAGSVEGAINIPLDKLPAQLSKLKGDKVFVVFCQSGARSARAKRIMDAAGFPHVINGGGWRQVNLAIIQKSKL